MNKSQKIFFNTGTTENKYVNIRLEQGVEVLEIMSMELTTKDAYQDFNADYGVLVGRVRGNGRVGIPNTKVSIFIPLMEEDEYDGIISGIYPYKTPRDTNFQGKRYNLLPRVSHIDPVDGLVKPKQAFGTFPLKEEILINDSLLEVYKKYYKYTTTTNSAGDYMIFGVPTGAQTVHMSVDITDIGEYSMNPAAMVTNLGYSSSQFTDNNTKIREFPDLDDLPHIETQEVSVDIIPFWGDTGNFEIGITRQDFRIRAELVNTFVMFGSAFTDSAEAMRGTENDGLGSAEKEIRDLYMVYPNSWADDSGDSDSHVPALATKRIGKIKEKIYYYPKEVTDYEITYADPTSKMKVLAEDQYSKYKRNGDFVFIVNCNRNKIITNEYGVKVSVDDDSEDGVFTEFRGFVTLEYTEDELPMISTSYLVNEQNKAETKPLRLKFKFPQHAKPSSVSGGGSFNYDSDGTTTRNWRKQHMKFEAQKFYSFSKFHACLANNQPRDGDNENGQFPLTSDLFFSHERAVDYDEQTPNINNSTKQEEYNIGPIQVIDHGDYSNTQYGMVGNGYNPTEDLTVFGANWLNLSVYFPQTGYMTRSHNRVKKIRTSDFLATQWEDDNDDGETNINGFFVTDNSMPIAAGELNTKWFGRSDLHWTDIIEVPVGDIKTFAAMTTKGFSGTSDQFIGNYRNGSYKPTSTTAWSGDWYAACPFNGGKINGNSENSTVDPRYYFYRGFNEADCIAYLYELGLII